MGNKLNCTYILLVDMQGIYSLTTWHVIKIISKMDGNENVAIN